MNSSQVLTSKFLPNTSRTAPGYQLGGGGIWVYEDVGVLDVVVVPDVVAWEVKLEFLWESLPFEKQREVASSAIGALDLPDLHGIVSKVVVEDVRDLGEHVEPEHLSVVGQKLLLGWHLSV